MAIGGKKGIRRLCVFFSLVCGYVWGVWVWCVCIDPKICFIFFSAYHFRSGSCDSDHVVAKRVVVVELLAESPSPIYNPGQYL